MWPFVCCIVYFTVIVWVQLWLSNILCKISVCFDYGPTSAKENTEVTFSTKCRIHRHTHAFITYVFAHLDECMHTLYIN